MTFPEQVYAIAKGIPRGCVASYGQLALLAGRPRAARIVGGAMSRCPSGSGVPCHRVVRSDGSLCSGDAFGAPGLQQELLRVEGVVFLPDGRVDMKRFQWDGISSVEP